jgi:ketosteroid isomerase-like protein
VPSAFELARELLLRWNRGDREVEDLVHDDVEIYSTLTSTSYRGREEAARWLREIDEQFSQWRLDFAEIDELDERTLLIRGSIFLRGRQSGAEFEQPGSWLIELEDELLRVMRTFPTRDGAEEYMRALG